MLGTQVPICSCYVNALGWNIQFAVRIGCSSVGAKSLGRTGPHPAHSLSLAFFLQAIAEPLLFRTWIYWTGSFAAS